MSRKGLVVAVFASVVVAAVAWAHLSIPSASNPYLARPGYVSPDSMAKRAAATATGGDGVILSRLARTPTAVWLTPEAFPASRVQTKVRQVSERAVKARRTPTFVVYGIPSRDCQGGHSSGGLSSSDYVRWVGQIAGGLAKGSAVILEPDALASAPACKMVSSRVSLLKKVSVKLARRGAAVYLDAGHANWLAPEQMAGLLVRSGVKQLSLIHI